jgi:hypothetical protein
MMSVVKSDKMVVLLFTPHTFKRGVVSNSRMKNLYVAWVRLTITADWNIVAYPVSQLQR